MIALRQGSSGIIVCGPMFKATDGVTLALGYTTNTLGITFYRMGATSTGDWATYSYTTGQTLTEVGLGLYSMGISSNPTSSIGAWRVMFEATSSGISFWQDYYVLPQRIYDSLYSSALGSVLNVNAAYLGSTGASMTSGIMDGSMDAFQTIVKYVGSTLTTMASGILSTSATSLNVTVGYWGSSNTAVTSGMMTSSLDAFLSAAKYWGTSTGALIASGSMSSDRSAMISLVDYWGATGNAIATNIGTGGRTFPELMTGLSAYLWGNSTYDGSTVAYYSSDGTVELWSALLTTANRTVTTNA